MTDLSRLREALSDRYLVLDELGRGGMATVYLAEDLRHARSVALKVVHPELLEVVDRERFLREIRITAGLTHPHIRPLLDSGDAGGFLYYVMPLVEGATLADRLERGGPLRVEEGVRLVAEVADALAYAHAQGVVHRDVKPSNVLLVSGHAVLSDFGIALPSGETSARMTTPGVTVGTAEYMSPEQCSGDTRVDERSDVYALGCVLHQCLAGDPPFTGRTRAAVIAKQLREPPPPLRSLRDEVPKAVEGAVLRALEKSPDDRFQTAGAMRSALLASLEAEPPFASPAAMRWAGAVLGVALLVALVLTLRPEPRPDLDDSRYAVMSFVQEEGAVIQLVDGSRCQTRLREALARWEDVVLVDPMVLRDRELRRNGRDARLEDALRDATDVAAGRMIWGQVWVEGDTTRVEAALYDVASGASIRRQLLAIGPGDPVAVMFDELADSLLVGQVSTAPARASAAGTRSLDALRLYDDGHRHLADWALGDAAQAFSAAVDRDPGYAHASLWRSLVGLFQGESYEEWRQYAAAAARSEEALSARERLVVRGLGELAEARWQEACAAFQQAIARDSLALDAWIGLGDCQARDPRVVPEPGSPSGWAFRSSFESAAGAYRRALALAPSYNSVLQEGATRNLTVILAPRVGNIRRGWTEGPDSAPMAAHPELDGDTVAYVPWPAGDLLARGIGSETFRAVERSRGIMEGITRVWASAFPEDARALQAHGGALEALGRVASTGDPLTSALDAVARVRALSPTGPTGRLAAVDEIRLLVKEGAFGRAALLSDSLLGTDATSEPAFAGTAAGVALLRGRVHLAARLLASSALEEEFWHPERTVTVPLPLRETSLRLLGYASAGGPADSLVALRARSRSQADAQVPQEERVFALSAATSEALTLAYATIPFDADDPPPLSRGNHLIGLFALQADGDAAAIREGLEAAERQAVALAVGSTPFSIAFSEARLWLSAGDTARAILRLDGVLESLRIQDQLLLTPREVGPLVRAMALRADLAQATADRATAARWARAVATLWSDADDATRPLRDRMIEITRTQGR